MIHNLFQPTFKVNWADLDANHHMRNTAYLDYAAQARFLFLNSNGFTPADFSAERIGPVVFSDEITYENELRFLEEFSVDLKLGGISEDGSKFVFLNNFINLGGKLCATVKTKAAWFDLQSRKLRPPPARLKKVLEQMDKSEDFHIRQQETADASERRIK
ncbi:MAG: thioesterase family protein [Desulfobacterales bacterium]|nr:MAG: thioesterase family protein [Desulfobacterales bacterium]